MLLICRCWCCSLLSLYCPIKIETKVTFQLLVNMELISLAEGKFYCDSTCRRFQQGGGPGRGLFWALWISRRPVDSSTAVPLTTSAHQSSSLAPTLIIWFNCGINTDHGSLPTLCKIVCKNLKNNNAVTFCQRKPQTAVNICIVHSLPVVRSHGWIYFQPILVNRRHHHQLWALGWLLHSIIAEE